jgi:RHS repeat-associated protein
VIEARLQPCVINWNTSGGGPSIMNGCNGTAPTGTIQEYGYAYGAALANNGNISIIDAYGPQAGTQNFARTYTYDQLNRLSALSQSSGNTSLCSSVFGLSWTYDPWANRTAQNVTGGTCYSFLVTANAQNQLIDTMRNAYQYDSAGNMIADGSYIYFYDAENRLIQAAPPGTTSLNSSTAIACYVYDALGRRVRKSGLGVSFTTDFVYDLSGNVVGEFAPTCSGSECLTVGYAYLNGQLVAQYSGDTTYFVHADHLGSTRLVTKMDKSVRDSLDYLPFGEQIAGDTATTHKFTGKERDSESDLDNFGARYYSSSLGRFMSPDWSATPDPVPYANLTNPQTLNLYAIVHDNPETFADLDGHNLFEAIRGMADFSGVDFENCQGGSCSGQQPPPSQAQQNQQQDQQQASQPASEASAEVMVLPLIGRAIIGAEEGAEGGAAIGSVEPGGGTAAGAAAGAVIGAATAALAPVVYTKTKEAAKEVARRLDTAITHLTSPNKLGGPDQDPRRGWRDTVRRSAYEIDKLADSIANKNLANAAHFTAQLLRGLVE